MNKNKENSICSISLTNGLDEGPLEMLSVFMHCERDFSLRPKKQKPLFPVTRPALFFLADPNLFFWGGGGRLKRLAIIMCANVSIRSIMLVNTKQAVISLYISWPSLTLFYLLWGGVNGSLNIGCLRN